MTPVLCLAAQALLVLPQPLQVVDQHYARQLRYPAKICRSHQLALVQGRSRLAEYVRPRKDSGEWSNCLLDSSHLARRGRRDLVEG